MSEATAAVLTGPRKFELRNFPLPEVGPDDGLLRMETNGLCGSDYDQYECKMKLQAFGKLPIIPGHEMVGWIERVGAQAAKRWNVREGDRVCVKAGLPCGACRQCVMGAGQRCELSMAYGFFQTTDVTPSLWGGYATHMYLHPNSQMMLAPTNIPGDVMTLFNPLSGAVRWVYEVPQLRMAEHVVILGPGQRGILAAVAAKQAGAKTVTVTGTDRDRHRLQVAKQLGADAVVDVTCEDLTETVQRVTNGEMADLVLDVTAGATEPILQAIDVARPGARIVLAGTKNGKPLSGLITDLIVFRELRLMGVYTSTQSSLEIALEILKKRHQDLAVMCSHVYPLESADKAVRVLGRELDDGRDVIHVNLNMMGAV